MKLFKIIASRSSAVVFDERIEAETPREAREKMKQALGIPSLTGVVYAITEIPLELLREIVTTQMAAITTTRGGTPAVDIAKLVGAAVDALTSTALVGIQHRVSRLETGKGTGRFDPMAESQSSNGTAEVGTIPIPTPRRRAETRPIPAPLRAILGPDWKAIKRRYLRDRSLKQTAAEFNVSVNTLKARIRREGWGK